VREVHANVPFYRSALDAAGFAPADLHSLDDLAALPFTRKSDFRDNYPLGLLNVPMEEVIRIHVSSGTTGKPTIVAYTRQDIDAWAEIMQRTFACGEVTSRDIVHNAYGYGLFTGGLGVHYGSERVGAATIPASAGNGRHQIMLIQDLRATVLCCTPSYSLYLAEVAQEIGLDLAQMNLRIGFLGAEPWTEQMRSQIEERLGIIALDLYGLSEVTGPGVAVECLQQAGLHLFEDHFLAEIVDPDTGAQLSNGEYGELVLTTLTKRAMPVIRYRTGDITRLTRERCACGRTLARMDRISGRTDDMIIVRGVNVFPSQIESVLLSIDAVQPHYLIIVDRETNAMDTLEIWVEVSEGVFSDELGALTNLQHRLESEIYETLRVSARVRLVEPHRIDRSVGKAKRVIDRRDLYRRPS
jgi:phenylacetate-CoA ligase